LGLDVVEDGEGLLHVVAGLPEEGVGALAAVVEAVLRARGAVEINDDFETELPGPGDCLGDVGRGAVGVGRAGVVVCPVADGYCERRVRG